MIFTNTFIEFLVAAVVVLISYYKWTYQYWKRKKIPYLEPSIPFGNFKPPHKRTLQIGFEIEEFYKIARANGWKHCGIYAMDNPVYLVCDLELCKLILTKDFNYFSDRGIYFNKNSDPISHHLFAMGGTMWKHTRTKLSPTFSPGKLKSMFPILNASRDTLLQFLDRETERGGPTDIKMILNKFGIDIIGSCAFGLECTSFDSDAPFEVYSKKALTGDLWRNIRDFLGANYEKFAKFLNLRVFEKDIADFFYSTVENTVQYRQRNDVTRPDLLQTLIELMYNEEEFKELADGQPFTMQDVVSQCFIFFIAGYESSTTTMTFILYELARHQDKQDKVRKEILDVLKGGELTYDSLSELKYMQHVIDETLRLYPPLPFITRECVEDWKIPGTDTMIEKGTKVFIPVKAFHYDPEYHEDPEKFIPERFEKKENLRPYSHMPFGEGPRICIGLRFGLMEAKVGLTGILKNYRVTVHKNTKEPPEFKKNGIIIQTKDAIWLNFEKLS